MSDPWIDRLSDFLDGELDAAARDAVEGHLRDCAECRSALADLRRVRDWASTFRPVIPAEGEWKRLERRIRHRRVGRWVLPSAAAVLVAGILGFFVLRAPWRTDGDAESRRASGTPTRPSLEAVLEHEDSELDALEASVRQRHEELDPHTRRVLLDALRMIDTTLDMVRKELEENPRDELLLDLQARSRDQKAKLLRGVLQFTRT